MIANDSLNLDFFLKYLLISHQSFEYIHDFLHHGGDGVGVFFFDVFPVPTKKNQKLAKTATQIVMMISLVCFKGSIITHTKKRKDLHSLILFSP